MTDITASAWIRDNGHHDEDNPAIWVLAGIDDATGMAAYALNQDGRLCTPLRRALWIEDRYGIAERGPKVRIPSGQPAQAKRRYLVTFCTPTDNGVRYGDSVSIFDGPVTTAGLETMRANAAEYYGSPLAETVILGLFPLED